ncbi:HEPN domain-containing protein [Candidatus Micrarchaeota archaeon]|nr:HEPN domain-containing protein [Candidatus Micrarchaeota archaeon]
MNVEECIASGLLKKAFPDLKKARASIETAEHKLEIAHAEQAASIFESAIVSAYTAMFHAARALLFKDGFKERSHYALSLFISEKYGDKIEKRFLSELDSLRDYRHELMYGIEKRSEVKEVEAESALAITEEFLKTIKKLL